MKWILSICLGVLSFSRPAFAFFGDSTLLALGCESGSVEIRLTKDRSNIFELGTRTYLDLFFVAKKKAVLVDRFDTQLSNESSVRLASFDAAAANVEQMKTTPWDLEFSSWKFDKATAESISKCLGANIQKVNQALAKVDLDRISPTLGKSRAQMRSANYFVSATLPTDPDPNSLDESKFVPKNTHDYKLESETRFIRVCEDNSVWLYDTIKSRIGRVDTLKTEFYLDTRHRTPIQLQGFKLDLKAAKNSAGKKLTDTFKLVEP